MERVTISPEFQIEIPASVRKALDLQPGQVLQVCPYEDRIELIPLRRPREFRGSMREMRIDFTREGDRI